jgi:Tol biopolymer transport system component/DNA-binding winged helix-turn-helix (wHTH) protein
MDHTNNPQSARILRFGVFEVDLKSRELRRSGLKIKLSAQPFDFLVLLLEHSGDVVTREELRRRLWPSDTFVDFDHGLNAAVRRLRDALGDSAHNPSFIETVARIGYRFIGNVERLNNRENSIPQTKIWSSHSTISLVIISVVLVLVLLGVKRLMTKPENSPMTSMPLVTYPGKEFSPSLSPSEQQVVFSWNGGSGTTSSLYEKVVGSDQCLRLTTAPNAIDFDPVWSPDGREIAFARVRDGAAGLYTVSPLGGLERKLLNTAWSVADTDGVFSPGRLDWSPDGKTIVFSDRARAEQPTALFLLSLDSMRTQQLTFPTFQTGDISPKFSPDGRLVAFVRDTTGGQSIYVIPAKGGLERPLASDRNPKVGLAWTEDGRDIVYGGGWLWRLPLKGGPAELLPFGQDGYQPSVRGNHIVYTQASEEISIWQRSLGPRPGRDAEQKLISSTRMDAGPQVSPDGSKIVYQSNRSGSFQIWVSNVDGTGARQLTHFTNTFWTGTPRWSPDGQSVAFDSRPNGDSDIFVMNIENGVPKRLTEESSNEVTPSWSRDGRWIYFASDRSSSWQVWKIPSSGGKSLQVTNHGGFAAFESLDGKALYYAKGLTVPGIWRVPPEGGEESQVLQMPEAGFWGFWAPVRNGIYFLDTAIKPRINFTNLSTHKTVKICDLKDPARETPGLTISPDGQSLLYTKLDEERFEITIVSNFY